MSRTTSSRRRTVLVAVGLVLTAVGGVFSFVLANYIVGGECPGGADSEGSRLPPAGDGYGLLCSSSGPSPVAHFAVLLALLAPLTAAFLAARSRRVLSTAVAGLVAVVAPFTVAVLLTLAPQDCTSEQWEEHGEQGCSTTTG